MCLDGPSQRIISEPSEAPAPPAAAPPTEPKPVLEPPLPARDPEPATPA